MPPKHPGWIGNPVAVALTIAVSVLAPGTSSPLEAAGGAWLGSATPPIWPPTFQVQFVEILNLGPKVFVQNNGTWFYNFANRTARFDHLRGQDNNFCQNQSLSPKDKSADCHLLFTKPGDMWVIYPDVQACCRLCGTAQGCTLLKPDWLTGAKPVETLNIGGRSCAGWAKQGAVAAADTWYADELGVPCRYHEVVEHFDHNLTFVPTSYSTSPIDAAVFEVPEYCKNECPRPYPQPPKH